MGYLFLKPVIKVAAIEKLSYRVDVVLLEFLGGIGILGLKLSNLYAQLIALISSLIETKKVYKQAKKL